MTANNSCGPHSATKAPPGTITPTVIKRAQDKATIRAMLAGVKRPEFPDAKPEGRYIDTGRVNVEPYVTDEAQQEYQREYRKRKARR